MQGIQKGYKHHCKETKISFWNKNKNVDIFMDEVTHTSLKEVWWKCPVCEHEWKKNIRTMADKRRKSICPNCKVKDI